MNGIAYALGVITIPVVLVVGVVLVVVSQQRVRRTDVDGPPQPGWWYDPSKGEWRPPGG